MAKVTVADLRAVKPVQTEIEHFTVDALGTITSVIDKADLSLRLHYLSCQTGATITCTEPPSDLCIYVVDGSLDVGTHIVSKGGCVVVEHGAHSVMRATAPTELAIFQDTAPTRKSGGRVHLIAAHDVPDNKDNIPAEDLAASALLADASCPNCDLWLHRNIFPEGISVDLHSHSEDEVILITGGQIILGARRFGPGTAVAVAKNAMYQFTAGEGGMEMINFRAGSPLSISAKTKRVIDEGNFFISRCGHPPHQYL